MDKKMIETLILSKPILTERTVIGIMTDKDIDDFISNSVMAAITGSDPEFAELFKKTCLKEFETENAVVLAIRLAQTGEYAGYFEIKHLDSVPEVGIDIVSSLQRKGLGYEVCRNVIDYLFQYTDISLLQYNCFKSNTASKALADKLGAQYVGEKVIFEHIQGIDISEESKTNAENFGLLMYEVRK